ncbi:S8 family serine peptidase [Streptacidiphilus jiangxiensis]|uniref:Subtilase family protein n=1 Tax=Streptacidiphilus jiangxiensis TaxID=235985 RepID=A0A1H7MUT5_STRJI|nr:S8 family serine peptidase [Streptacidiphilus jiangxiensis]SEL14974.1 Subtilase family protein [Streptacidiphilus jiangxiensis]
MSPGPDAPTRPATPGAAPAASAVPTESAAPAEAEPVAPPWRGGAHRHVVGVPAYGARTSGGGSGEFPLADLPGVGPAWAWGGADGAGVRVCVVDSGVEGGHPLVGEVDRSVTVVDREDGTVGIADCPPTDVAGHGTACAGVIRAIAPGVSLSSARVLTDGKNGSGDALLAGLSWAVEEGFDVVNLSLATTRQALAASLHELADRAYFRRCTLVVSAHNRPVPSFPWSFASVVSVASHDEDGPMTYYYNPAPPVEFHARGVRVPVAWPGGGTIRSTGNSFAAPHIAGLCALVLSKHPWLTPAQLKTVLFQCAANVAHRTGGAHEPGR